MRVHLKTKDTEVLKELQTHLENNGYNSKEAWDTDNCFNFDEEHICEIKTILKDRGIVFVIEEIQNFKNNLNKNFKKFKEEMLLLSKEQLFDEWYKLNFYNSFYEFLGSDFVENRIAHVPTLLKKNSPLDHLYKIWLECDDAPSGDWDVMLEFVLKNCEED